MHCIVIGLNQPMATASFLGRLPPSLLDTEGIQKGYRRDTEGIQKGYRRTDNTMPKKKKKKEHNQNNIVSKLFKSYSLYSNICSQRPF
jgi:hypothetical protein